MCNRVFCIYLLNLRPDSLGVTSDNTLTLNILLFPNQLLALRAIWVLTLEVVDGGGRMSRANAEPLALLRPDVFGARGAQRG